MSLCGRPEWGAEGTNLGPQPSTVASSFFFLVFFKTKPGLFGKVLYLKCFSCACCDLTFDFLLETEHKSVALLLWQTDYSVGGFANCIQ